MNVLTYKGYAARIEFDAEDRIFVGHLAGIDDIVTFHGSSVDELETAFHEAVDHYLEVSERTGHRPQTPYSGELRLRLSPDLHAKIAMAAEIAGKSLDQWMADAAERAVR
jgi:predicted HicB family RNase H-like nuclease